MKCEECRELASAWIDGEAEPGVVPALLMHLSECSDCRSFFSFLPAQIRLLREEGSQSRPRPLLQQIAPLLLHYRRKNRTHIPASLAAAAAIIAIVMTLAVESNLQHDASSGRAGTSTSELEMQRGGPR